MNGLMVDVESEISTRWYGTRVCHVNALGHKTASVRRPCGQSRTLQSPWHHLTNSQSIQWVRSRVCLMDNRPGRLGWPARCYHVPARSSPSEIAGSENLTMFDIFSIRQELL